MTWIAALLSEPPHLEDPMSASSHSQRYVCGHDCYIFCLCETSIFNSYLCLISARHNSSKVDESQKTAQSW